MSICDVFHVKPDFAGMQVCLCKISGDLSSNTEGVVIWGSLQTFKFYKFGKSSKTYMIYDECCLQSWKHFKERILLGKNAIYPMEVTEDFFNKYFIVMEKSPGEFDGPQFI
jgi:hypothetical protein